MTHFKTEKLLNKMNKNISNKIFGKLASKVKRKVFLCFFFFIIVFDCAVFEASAQNFGRNGFGQRNLAGGRESRKLFGGYRITPQYCKPIRAGRRNRGETICMFNHECTRRDGEVVGACMDGFLFGACCQLKETKELHIPKGPGVVMHHYLNSEDEISESDALGSYNDFGNTPPTQETYHFSTINNIVTPTKLYTEIRTTDQDISSPSSNDLSTASPGGYVGFSTEKMTSQSDVFSDGLSQITSSLLNEPPKNVELNNGDHLFNKGSSNEAETILLHQNGSAVEDVLRPSDFTLDSGIEVSNMQTKPTSVATPSSSSSTIPSTMYTHKPIYQKPGFKPKPFKKPTTTTTEKYILVQTVTKPEKIPPSMTSSADFVPEQASIDSILQMLNDTTPTKIDEEAATQSIVSELSSNSEVKEVTRIPATVPPVSYTSGYPPSYISSSRYPSTSTRYPSTSTRYPSTSNKYTSTSTRYPTTSNKYQSTSTRYPSTSTRYPSTSTRYPSTSTRYPSTSTRYPSTSTKYPSTGHFITTVKTPSTSYVYGSTLPQKPQVTEDGTRLPITNTASYDNYYQTSPFDTTSDEDKLTTVSYVSSSTTRRPTTTTRKPPSTSYIYSGIATKRPISSVQNYGPTYDIAPKPDSFSSVTPTVIVLGGLNQQTPESAIVEYQTAASEDSPDNFVEIPQEPFKKPVSQVTINNVISSTHNIHLGQKKPVPSNAKPTPTVLITPKPTSTSAYEAWPEATTTHDPNRYTISSSIGTTPSSLSSTYSVQSANPEPQFPESLYVPNHKFSTTIVPEMQTSPDDLINFPPVRNPNLNATGSNPNTVFNSSISMGIDDLSILQEVEFTTPSFLQEDEVLNDKMSIFVSKIVGSLQGTFQELHDIVILDKKPNTTITRPASTAKPTKKPAATTKKPPVTTKKPTRVGTTATKKPTKKPVRVTTATKKPTTTPAPTTVVTTTKKPVRATSTTKKPKPTKKVTTTSPTPTSTEIFDEVTTDSLDTTTIDYEDRELCGVRPMVRSGRIVGGKNAAFGEWPWQVMVRESTWLGLFTKNKCGGVLITNRYVTTAAHCQPGFLASLVAVFGEHDISGDLEKKRPITKNVRRVIVHRLYDAATFENDLALLELDTPVKFDSHIVPICMPPDEADYTGRMASVTGWGRLKYGGGVPAILQEVQVPVIENSVCQEMFQTAGHSKIILNSFLCAGYANGQKDSCEGDSGGPLVLQRADGRWQLIGTVSHGIKCAAPYLPGVYMRTTFYKPWLKSITGVN